MSLLMRAQTTSVTPVMRGIHPRVRSFAGLEFERESLRQRDGGGRARAGLESRHRHWARVMIPWRCRLRKFRPQPIDWFRHRREHCAGIVLCGEFSRRRRVSLAGSNADYVGEAVIGAMS
jgi:hypothetical protein